LDEAPRCRAECDRLRGLDTSGGLCFALCLDRIATVATQIAGSHRLGAGSFKADIAHRTEAMPMRPPVNLEAIQPALASTLGDLKIEPSPSPYRPSQCYTVNFRRFGKPLF
jgi:hypothetical protein